VKRGKRGERGIFMGRERKLEEKKKEMSRHAPDASPSRGKL